MRQYVIKMNENNDLRGDGWMNRHPLLTLLFFFFGIPAHDFMKVRTWKSGVLRGMGDIAPMDGEFG